MRTRTLPVAAGLTATVATLLTGCAHTQTADCVDARGNLLPDSACSANYGTGAGGALILLRAGGPRYIYGGRINRSGGFAHISGGSFAPSSTSSISTRSGTNIISRGGFGESAGFHGGGGFGEGGGE